MVTGILVPHEIRMPIRNVELSGLADYQAAVDGYIETVQLPEHQLVIVANEDGKVNRLPINRRATMLWWLLSPSNLARDALVGDVLVLGPIKGGEMTDTPPRISALLLDARHYQVEVRLSEQFDTWVSIGEPVQDFFESARRALRLMEVWSPRAGVRVATAK